MMTYKQSPKYSLSTKVSEELMGMVEKVKNGRKGRWEVDEWEDNYWVVIDPMNGRVWAEAGLGEGVVGHAGMEVFRRLGEVLEKEDDQYFAKDLWVVAYKEFWFMWAMAWEHSRIKRVYFWEENKRTGGLGGWKGDTDMEFIEIQTMRNEFAVFKVTEKE
jgi:tRNA(Arg) A34 adenosine deaminase TadA